MTYTTPPTKGTFSEVFSRALKERKIKRYDVCDMLGITMPTLKSRVDSPIDFTMRELLILYQNGLNFFDYFFTVTITKD